MKSNIYEISRNFDFSELSLANPAPVQGGSYFTKLSIGDKNNLIFQMPKCKTKAGIIKTGKKYYCDLLFSSTEDNLVIQWFEAFEDKCRELICEKKHIWFQDDLDDNDIETMLTSSMRLYKSGKNILVRVLIMGNPHVVTTDAVATVSTPAPTNNIKCTIYDETEKIKNLEDVTPDKNIIPLVWFTGIKFTEKEFKLEINLNQIMLLDDVPLFDTSCRIKHVGNNTVDQQSPPDVHVQEAATDVHVQEAATDVHVQEAATDVHVQEAATDVHVQETNVDDLGKQKDLEEVEIGYNISDQEMNLKNPNEVYIEIYKVARTKAKQLKTAALEAFLDAKMIKSRYMLDDLDIDSDSDSDSEYESANSLAIN